MNLSDPEHPPQPFSGYAITHEEAERLQQWRKGINPVDGEIRTILSAVSPHDPPGFRLGFPSIFFFGRWYRLDTNALLIAKTVNTRLDKIEVAFQRLEPRLKKIEDELANMYPQLRRSLDRDFQSAESRFEDRFEKLEAVLAKLKKHEAKPEPAPVEAKPIPPSVGRRRPVRGPKGKIYPSVQAAARAYAITSPEVIRRIRAGDPNWIYGDGTRIPALSVREGPRGDRRP